MSCVTLKTLYLWWRITLCIKGTLCLYVYLSILFIDSSYSYIIFFFLFRNIEDFNISKKVINLANYLYGGMIAFQMSLQAEQDPKQYPEMLNLILLERFHNHEGSYFRFLLLVQISICGSSIYKQYKQQYMQFILISIRIF